MFLAKDFIETREGLIFAVVENGLEQEKVLCFLRYHKLDGQWKKLETGAANNFLSLHYPHYLYYSSLKQAHLHAVCPQDIIQHHQPRKRLKSLLNDQATDSVINDLLLLCHLFKDKGLNLDLIGVTGSVLIAAQKQSSDIDLVFYCREIFHQARALIPQLINQGACSELDENAWKTAFNRRNCEITYADYLWHELRKKNKLLINQRKVDLSFVSSKVQTTGLSCYKKLQATTLKVQVFDASLAFDYPAIFLINHPHIHSIVCYTATYTGQAEAGEWVEVAGFVEQAENGEQRIVVGSTREAKEQYIKVMNE